MSTKLSKTDYIIYRDCSKNAWVKVNKPKVYNASDVSEFEKMIMETRNEVDELARKLFPTGVLIKHNSKKTKELIAKKVPVIYQPKFESEKYTTTPDMLVWNRDSKAYDMYEVKSTNGGPNKKAKEEVYAHDIAFQACVLKELGVPLANLYLVRLNPEYVRKEKLDIKKLFQIDDFTNRIERIEKDVTQEMQEAYGCINGDEPAGSCACIGKGRSMHCTTFTYSNPHVPEYSVHDIVRIGLSKKKLASLIDAGVLSIADIPASFEFSVTQQNQIDTHKNNRDIIAKSDIEAFLRAIQFPVSFIDYETFPAAVPRYSGYKPYVQIPFQFSLYIMNSPEAPLEHWEFIHTANTSPDEAFLAALKKSVPNTGSIIVWNKRFEMGINQKLAERVSGYEKFVEEINARVVDLMDVFSKQFYVSKEFRGSTSIKNILPALVPSLSYKKLKVKDGGTAAGTWDKIVNKELGQKETKQQIQNLLEYCKMDTLAMVKIFEVLRRI